MYRVTSTTASGVSSRSFQCDLFKTHILLNFWSGKVFHTISLEAGPRGTLVPKRTTGVISSYLALFDSPPSWICLVDCPDRLCACFQASFSGKLKSSSVCGFNYTELERCLSTPTSRMLERHDYRTILLMKLRTALDRAWLQCLASLYKVN